MRTPASIAGHPIHPMLVGFPIGFFGAVLVSDVISIWGNPAFWPHMSLWLIAFGVIGALLAAVFGLVDLLSLPARIRSTALAHMGINLTIVVLFAIDAWLRLSGSDPVWLSVVAILLLLVSGWLGGKMVYRLGVAVDAESASVDAR